MEQIPKVPKPEFDALLSKLLETAPLPEAEMPRKRQNNAKTTLRNNGREH